MDDPKIRNLPAVHRILDTAAAREAAVCFGRDMLVSTIQSVLAETRAQLLAGESISSGAVTPEGVAEAAVERLAVGVRPVLRPAVNATGILLHTGLGRAPMPAAAREAVAAMAGTCNLQMDLTDGARVHREHVVRELVCGLTGAEDVLLVNNNAAATMLVLRALAAGREVVVSRGELIEIGGSFRLPDIMQESGAILREVGTTNKTHLRDYERAITPDTAMLLKVHKSNYDIIGFTKEVGIAELAAAGHACGVPVLDDLGCGALTGLEAYGLPHEMTLGESLAAGADLALASTDKLIGGPQGGLIIGNRELVGRIRNHPLYRALRVCKLTLAALEATLRLFKNPERLVETHPLYAMLGRKPLALREQAETLAQALGRVTPEPVSVVPHDAYLGGGSLPGATLPSFAVQIKPTAIPAAALARALREAACPVVGRVNRDAVLLDMRTVAPAECDAIVRTFRGVCA